MSRSIRSLHTSLRLASPANRGVPSFGARAGGLGASGPSQRDILASAAESLPYAPGGSPSGSSRSNSSGGAEDIVRRGWETGTDRPMGMPEERRRTFSVGQRIAPYQLTRPNLYPTPRPAARPPLLGPGARIAKQIDPFILSNTKPLDYTFNPEFGRAFTNTVGRILGRKDTGLSWKSQRGIGKLIRRQQAMGLLPRFSGVKTPGGYGNDGFWGR